MKPPPTSLMPTCEETPPRISCANSSSKDKEGAAAAAAAARSTPPCTPGTRVLGAGRGSDSNCGVVFVWRPLVPFSCPLLLIAQAERMLKTLKTAPARMQRSAPLSEEEKPLRTSTPRFESMSAAAERDEGAVQGWHEQQSTLLRTLRCSVYLLY